MKRALVYLWAAWAAAAMATEIQTVSWLAGTWQGRAEGGGCVEETWTAPVAGRMPGFFRWLKGEEVVVYEVLQIREDDGRWLYEFKHFGGDLVGWEKRKDRVTFQLTNSESGVLRFEEVGAKQPMSLTYTPKGANSLQVVLVDAGGTPTTFEYSRRAAGSPPTGC